MAQFNLYYRDLRLILDDKDKPRKIKSIGQVLASHDLSLLVIDSSRNQNRGGMWPLQVIILALLPKKNSQSVVTGVLGALLKQVVDELEGVPGETT